MGVDFFVHGVFGVIPEGPFIDRFYRLLNEKLGESADVEEDDEAAEDDMPAEVFTDDGGTVADRLVEHHMRARRAAVYDEDVDDEEDADVFDNETDRVETYAQQILEANPDLLLELQEQYQAPGAELFYTGSDDDRPGRCDCDSEIWLFGYGLFDLATVTVPPAFVAVADYHSWVEAG